MTLCLNPKCQQPQNPDTLQNCQNCGSSLLLGDRYRAIQPIGQGGFGRTFLAIDEAYSTDTEKGKRAEWCVIKQLFLHHPNTPPEKAIALFAQEAERLAELGQHPQIPTLMAHFEQNDTQYLVQEFIDGQNLAEVLDTDGTWNEAQIRSLLADLLPVLEFIHSRHVIHRDIKPENIILPFRGGKLALVDFGASRYASDTALARTGTVIGSAGYVAPEQAMGKAKFASDLYSLGVTCVHLLTGMHPFDLYSVGEDAWVWRQYLPQPISLELRRVLDKLLQRATRQRYQDAVSVMLDLRLGSASPQTIAQTSAPDAVRPPTGVTRSRPNPSLSSPAQQTSGTSSSRTVNLAQQWQCIQTLTEGVGEVTAIALSPNGQWLASGGSDKAIRIWNLKAGERWHTFAGRSLWSSKGHSDCINALVFSPDSEILISASEDGTAKQWDLVAWEEFSTLSGHGWGVPAIALSPDGYILAMGSGDGVIQIWDLETEKLLATLSRHQEAIAALAISSNGQVLASGSADKTICLWNFETDQWLNTLKGHVDRVSAIAFSPDVNTLISGSWDRTLKIWNLRRGEQVKVIAAHRDRINTLAVHPSGKFFASGSEDGSIKLWDLATGDRLCTLRHTWAVNVLTFSRNGQLLVSGSADETIKIWRRQG